MEREGNSYVHVNGKERELIIHLIGLDLRRTVWFKESRGEGIWDWRAYL